MVERNPEDGEKGKYDFHGRMLSRELVRFNILSPSASGIVREGEFHPITAAPHDLGFAP